MIVNELIRQKKLTKYKVAKDSGNPYSAETLLESCQSQRIPFELFKSNVCHQVKELGDIAFMIRTLENDEIRTYYQRGWYPESLYLLAMLDYLSRENEIPLCTRYDDLRSSKLSEVVFPAGVLAVSAVAKNDQAKKKAIKNAIPEFMRFNIVECEVRDVV